VLAPDAIVIGQPGAEAIGVEQVAADLFGAAAAEVPDIDHLREAITQQHGLEGGGDIAQLEAIRNGIEIGFADVAGAGLVERVVADDDIGQVFELAGDLLEGVDEMGLQVFLDGQAVDTGLRGEVVAGEEEREHGGGGELLVVGGPDHGRERTVVFGLGEAAPVALKWVRSRPRPRRSSRGAIATREAAPDILMRVNKEAHAVLPGQVDDGIEVVEVIHVVDAGTGVLDGFPGHDQALEGQPPGAQAGKCRSAWSSGKGRPTKETLR